MYGGDKWTDRQCQNWFAKFRFDIFASRAGRAVVADNEKIEVLDETNRRMTTHENTESLNRLISTLLDKIFTRYKEIGACLWRKNKNYFRVTQ